MAASKSQYFSGFDPRQLSNCQLWLDGADFSSFTFSTGSNVTRWRDKSGNAYDASAIGVPTRAAGPTGLTGVVLNGSTNFVGSIANTTNVLTAFVVVDMSASTVNNGRLLSLARAGTDDFGNALDCACIIRNQSLQRIQTYRANADRSIVDISYNTPFVGTALFTGASNTDYRNGVAGTTIASTGNFGYSLYGLGNYPQYIGIARWTGTVYEVILYNQALGSNDRQAVEGYLAWKWRLNSSLLSNHVYRQVPNVTRPFSPLDVSSCFFWVDAADASTFDLSGNIITAWRNKSYSNIPLTRTGFATYSNGSVVFTGTQNFVNSSISLNMSNMTVFLVGYNSPGGAGVSGGFVSLVPIANGVDFNQANAITYNYDQGTPGNLFTTYNFTATSTNFSFTSATSPIIFSHVQTGTMSLFTVGSNFATRAGLTPTTTTGISIGARYQNGNGTASAFLLGRVNEIIIYSTALSTFQRQQVEGYLSWKWNRQSGLQVTHPFKTYYPLASAFNPLAVTNCALWLDATDVSSFTFSSGSNITFWRDKSGNARDASAIGVPTYSSNGVVFTGTQVMNTPLSSVMLSQTTFIVASANSINKMDLIGINAPTYTNGIQVFLDNYVQTVTRYGGTAIMTGGTVSPNTRFLYDATYISGGQSFLYLNGSQTGSNATSATISGSATVMVGGYFDTALKEPYIGTINEIIIYTQSLSSNERQFVEGYLAWKWGLQNSFPLIHPFKTLDP